MTTASAPLLPPALSSVLPGHLGPLHTAETLLVVLLAFGPFVVLAVVVYLQRRKDGSDDES